MTNKSPEMVSICPVRCMKGLSWSLSEAESCQSFTVHPTQTDIRLMQMPLEPCQTCSKMVVWQRNKLCRATTIFKDSLNTTPISFAALIRTHQENNNNVMFYESWEADVWRLSTVRSEQGVKLGDNDPGDDQCLARGHFSRADAFWHRGWNFAPQCSNLSNLYATLMVLIFVYQQRGVLTSMIINWYVKLSYYYCLFWKLQ